MGKKMSKAKRGRRKKSTVDIAEAEWIIMKVVWENEACAAGTVQEILEESKGWTYGTIKSTMDRMVEKGFLKVERIRYLQLFRSCISEVEAKRIEFRKMLRRAFDGALTPMMQFLIENDELSEQEYSCMEDMIKNRKRRKASPKKKN